MRGDNRREVALIADNLSVLYLDMGRFADAEKLGRQALDAFERIGGEADRDAVYSLNNLAAIYKATGRSTEALNFLQRAIDLTGRTPVLANDPVIAMLNDNLAGVFADRGDQTKAAEYHLKAYEIFVRLRGADSPDVGIASHNIASLYADMKDYTKAKDWYRTALRTYERVYGRKHGSYATSLRRLAEVHERENAPDLALPLLEEALQAELEVLPEDHPDIVRTLVGIGSVQTLRGDFAKAYEAYNRACEMIVRRWHDGRTEEIRERAFRGLQQTIAKLENEPGQDREKLLRQAFDAAQWIGNTQTAGWRTDADVGAVRRRGWRAGADRARPAGPGARACRHRG